MSPSSQPCSLLVTEQIPYPARKLEGLVQRLLRVNREDAVRMIHDGAVRVNRRIVTRPYEMLEVGDELVCERILPQATIIKAKEKIEPVRTVFEDDAIIVVRKPAGLLTVPTPQRESRTLISIVTAQLRRHSNRPDAQAFSVHRLDRGVSGLVIFAKSLVIAEKMREQFATRKAKRIYQAFAVGRLPKDQGTIQTYLATDAQLNRYSVPEGEGELAITHYEVLQRWRDLTRLAVRLETGRRNQIRVHLSELGYPLLGDERYGRLRAQHRYWPYKRVALHAEMLEVEHPLRGELLHFRAPLPSEFHRLITKLGSPMPE